MMKETSKRFNSIICLGLDPVIDEIPLTGSPGEQIVKFYKAILNILDRCAQVFLIFKIIVRPQEVKFVYLATEGLK